MTTDNKRVEGTLSDPRVAWVNRQFMIDGLGGLDTDAAWSMLEHQIKVRILDMLPSSSPARSLVRVSVDDLEGILATVERVEREEGRLADLAPADQAVLIKAVRELKPLVASAELRHRADRRARDRWHAHGNNARVWPDHADLVLWLLAMLDARPIGGDVAKMIDQAREMATRLEVQRDYGTGHAGSLLSDTVTMIRNLALALFDHAASHRQCEEHVRALRDRAPAPPEAIEPHRCEICGLEGKRDGQGWVNSYLCDRPQCLRAAADKIRRLAPGFEMAEAAVLDALALDSETGGTDADNS